MNVFTVLVAMMCLCLTFTEARFGSWRPSFSPLRKCLKQVCALKDSVESLQTENGDLAEQVTNLTQQLSVCQQDKVNLNDQLKDAKTNITILQQNVATLTANLNDCIDLEEETAQKLETLCPDSTNLKDACVDGGESFSFITTTSGCQAICYTAFTVPMTYTEAETACAQHDGTLITLETMEKNALMVDEIRKWFPTQSFWIGLKYDNNWNWKGGQQMTFSDWATGEPDNNQDCASLNSKVQHRWFDRSCSYSTSIGALCEITI